MDTIYHITDRRDWESAQFQGFYSPVSLDLEGFIHCSTPDQTEETANLYYKGRVNLVLLCIETKLVKADLRFEGAASEDSDAKREGLFPHIYGNLNLDAVVDVVAFPPNTEGKFYLPKDLK
ncbi:DUF952 domain-containing protein [Chondrinema litorale]|uniref:DUF952 domain-containing protein n=1 Tax=Chondrinema litorale TaxID=2994555 RepID=UPI0025427C34|nr:DUF952 domain-containing protein [Chondrinema litorale]UZR97277.1 DUF952 domain-containing protein [Chondrinema litorale]